MTAPGRGVGFDRQTPASQHPPAAGWGWGDRQLNYETPVLKPLGTFAGLTQGQGGSCPDGAGRNVSQRGGGSIGGTSNVNCGPGPGGNPGL